MLGSHVGCREVETEFNSGDEYQNVYVIQRPAQ